MNSPRSTLELEFLNLWSSRLAAFLVIFIYSLVTKRKPSFILRCLTKLGRNERIGKNRVILGQGIGSVVIGEWDWRGGLF